MINLRDIHSLTDFQRSAKRHLASMKRTGRPRVLTINGKAELIVQDAESYQRLLALVDEAETVLGIRRGLDAFQRDRGLPASAALAKIRKRHAIPHRDRT